MRPAGFHRHGNLFYTVLRSPPRTPYLPRTGILCISGLYQIPCMPSSPFPPVIYLLGLSSLSTSRTNQ
nr:MAG TPA: hypothetical protein [Caudoviricetes sp.]